jgi:hypothetical protein
MTDISTYMSLTLARLCGEWQLVSGNYKAWGASGGKYKAQIVIFCTLATVNFLGFLGKWKAVEENWKAVEEIGKLLKKLENH